MHQAPGQISGPDLRFDIIEVKNKVFGYERFICSHSILIYVIYSAGVVQNHRGLADQMILRPSHGIALGPVEASLQQDSVASLLLLFDRFDQIRGEDAHGAGPQNSGPP